MRLVDFFESTLAEGLADSKTRQFVSDFVDKVMSAVFDEPTNLKFFEESFIFDSPCLTAEHDGFPGAVPTDAVILFHFVSREERKRLHPEHRVRGGDTYLTVPITVGDEERAFLALPTSEVAARTLFAQNEQEVRKQFDVLVHEMVHAVDRKKIGKEKWRELHKKSEDRLSEIPDDDKTARDTEIVNEPTETNAYFQQVAAVVAKDAKAHPQILSDINTFYKYFLKRSTEFVDDTFSLWEPRNISHLKKRVAQLFADLKKSG